GGGPRARPGWGGAPLLLNTAPPALPPPGATAPGLAALDDFDPHFRLNVAVPLRLSARLAQRCWLHAGPENRARNRNIVNVSSISGSEVYPGQTLYSASKAALNQLTRTVAAEFAEFGVRVNAIAPTTFPVLVPTELVARAIVELDASDRSGGVYGVGVELDRADGSSLRLADAEP
uniref:SDR family oxidoreductase n=1 Tax=Nocardia abscessus TaxID=120957 RepID=UPI0024573FC1